MRTHTQQYARSEHHTQLAKMSFDEIFDLTAEVYFYFYDVPGNIKRGSCSIDPQIQYDADSDH